MQKKADTTASGAPFAAAANGAAEDGHPSAAAEAGGASEAQVPSAGNGSDSETDLTPPVTEVIAEGFTPSVSDDGSTWRGDPARRIDPTRYERVVAAMKLVRRLKPDKRHSERGYPYVSKAALYDHIRQCLAACGLHVRSRLNKPIEVCADLDLGSTRSNKSNVATIEIDVSFAFAAPLDGADASLHWEQRPLSGPCRDVQSQGHLWGLTRKYWLQDALLVSEDEVGQTAAIDPEQDQIDGSSMERVGRQRARRNAGPSRQQPPNEPPNEPPPDDRPPDEPPVDPSIDIEDKIRRGVDRAGLSPADASKLRKESGENPTAMLRALIQIVAKKDAEAGAVPPNAGAVPPNAGAAPPKAGADPAAEREEETLTFEQRKEVVTATRAAGIADDTVGRIIRGLLGTETLGKLTLAKIKESAKRYDVPISDEMSWTDVMIAMVKHLQDRAPALDHPDGGDHGSGNDGTAPPPAGGESDSTESGPSATLDPLEAAHANIAAASMLTLEKKDPAAAERIKMGQYDTWRERSAAIDAAIAEAEYRARAAAAKPRAAGKEPSAKPGSGDGSGRPKPLSLAEQIAFQVRDIPDDQLRVLKKMAKGDDRTLLDLAEKFHKNG